VRQAPIQRAFIASDGTADRWLLLWLSHHLVIDHVSLELVSKEVRAHMNGEQGRLGRAVAAYRNFVAQARLGISPAGA